MAIAIGRFIVVCTGPLRGHDPRTEYFDTKADARTFAEKNVELYHQIDMAEVQYRALTRLMPQTELQRADDGD